MRRFLLLFHRWTTFILGALLVLVCTTGSALIILADFDPWFAPALYQATPGDVGIDRAIEVAAAEGGRDVSRLWVPREGSPLYVAELTGRPVARVFVDPGSGEVRGRRDRPFYNAVRSLHGNLLLGARGSTAVGISAVVLTLMMASGVWLWWPGIRRLATGLRIRRRGGAAIVNYDLHNVVGVLTLPLLLLITVTGAAIVWPRPTRFAMHLATGEARTAMPDVSARDVVDDPAGERLSFAALVARARQAEPNLDVLNVVPAKRPEDGVQVRFSHPDAPFSDGLARVVLDPYDGRVVATTDLSSLSTADRLQMRWVYALHVGHYGGTPMRLLYALIGLAPLGLAVTGLTVWWMRRRGRLALAERRAAQRAA